MQNPGKFARSPVLQQWILRLLFPAIALPILICLLVGLGHLLSALGDADGSLVVGRVNLALAVFWVFDVLLLIIALALGLLLQDGVRGHTPTEEGIARPGEGERSS
jgi:hypothetical protein